MTTRGPVPVEVRPSRAPDGSNMVLLQLPDGYVLMTPDGAFDVARLLEDVAAEVDSL